MLYRLKANYFGLIRIELKERKRAYSAIFDLLFPACVTADRLPVRQYTTGSKLELTLINIIQYSGYVQHLFAKVCMQCIQG